jgi:hypothetical protein
MSDKLQRLIELARRHQITEDEHEAQVKSFTYGNTHFENEDITRKDVDEAVDSLKMTHGLALK